MVALVVGKSAFVLKAPYNDRRRHASLLRERRNLSHAQPAETLLELRRDRRAACKPIRLIFKSQRLRVRALALQLLRWLDKDLLLPVHQDVRRLVKEREPKY